MKTLSIVKDELRKELVITMELRGKTASFCYDLNTGEQLHCFGDKVLKGLMPKHVNFLERGADNHETD